MMQSRQDQTESLGRDQWLSALWSREAKLDLDLAGHSALNRSWKIGPRKMDRQFIFFVEKGEATGHIEGKPTRLRPGTLFWANLGALHYFRPYKDFPAPTCYHLRFRVLVNDTSVGYARSHFLVQNAFRYQWLIEEIHHNMNHPHELASERLKSLYFYLYSELEQASENVPCRSRKLGPSICSKLTEYVKLCPRNSVSPADLAKVAGLSHDYFTRIFRNTFGIPPRQWLHQECIKQAAIMLTNSPQHTISQIAEESGFCDVFLFSRQFKKVMGHSPSRYRELYG